MCIRDRLYKLRPLINELIEKSRSNYNLSSHVVVDESLQVAFKGRSSLKQYIPLKPVKPGYKIWCLADSQTGYVYNFEMYTGRLRKTGMYSMCEICFKLLSPYSQYTETGGLR